MMDDPRPENLKTPRHRLVLVTGPSGAGRSTAINALEDLGYEAIDNLPLSLVPRLLEGPPLDRPLALGVDARNRDFSTSAMIELVDQLNADANIDSNLLYLDARADILVRRFSETRRRHPLAPADAPQDGIRREFDLLAPIRARAQFLIDTSDLSPHDLRAELAQWFADSDGASLALSVQSFSYKRGLPRGLDIIFDCRFLQNPHWKEELRNLNGTDDAVAEYVTNDPKFAPFFDHMMTMVQFLLPAFKEEGKTHLSIGFGCTGGQHRSVSVTEKMANTLAHKGWRVSIRHRELERYAQDAPNA